jgi:hypothetical protein
MSEATALLIIALCQKEATWAPGIFYPDRQCIRDYIADRPKTPEDLLPVLKKEKK